MHTRALTIALLLAVVVALLVVVGQEVEVPVLTQVAVQHGMKVLGGPEDIIKNWGLWTTFTPLLGTYTREPLPPYSQKLMEVVSTVQRLNRFDYLYFPWYRFASRELEDLAPIYGWSVPFDILWGGPRGYVKFRGVLVYCVYRGWISALRLVEEPLIEAPIVWTSRDWSLRFYRDVVERLRTLLPDILREVVPEVVNITETARKLLERNLIAGVRAALFNFFKYYQRKLNFTDDALNLALDKLLQGYRGNWHNEVELVSWKIVNNTRVFYRLRIEIYTNATWDADVYFEIYERTSTERKWRLVVRGHYSVDAAAHVLATCRTFQLVAGPAVWSDPLVPAVQVYIDVVSRAGDFAQIYLSYLTYYYKLN